MVFRLFIDMFACLKIGYSPNPMGEYILFPVNIAEILGQLPTLIIDDLPEITTGAEKNPWTLAEKPGISGERVNSWQQFQQTFGNH